MNYVQVAVNVPQVTGVFDYHVPAEMEGKIQPGCLVVVPFGKQSVQGIVLREVEKNPEIETREVDSLLDDRPVITASQLKLAEWLAHETLAPLASCLGMMLPVGLRQMADSLFSLNQEPGVGSVPLTPLQERILSELKKRGSLRGRQLDTAFSRLNWRNSAQSLIRRGFLSAQPILPPASVRPKYIRTVQLAVPPEKTPIHADSLGRASAGQRRLEALQFLVNEPWPVNVAWVYAASGCHLKDLQVLEEKGLVILSESEIWRDPVENLEWQPTPVPVLTRDQAAAWEVIGDEIEKTSLGKRNKPVLLRGVTGSGKTELYLRAVEETIKQGSQAIILVPEIALTPQTIRRFMARFPGKVGLTHSRLSIGERYDTWRRAREGLLSVIIGPRSALFQPLQRLKLIVVDECHDDSYYQDETPPFNHTASTAIAYAEILGGLAILGSATPDVTQLYRAQKEAWNRLDLPSRVRAHVNRNQEQVTRQNRVESPYDSILPLPPVKVVDMRDELKAGNRTIFSRSLQKSLADSLAAGQQAILFLNRRGSSTYVFCRECGFSMRCPNCEIPLIYHTQENHLVCHTCNYQRNLPQQCPECGSAHIRQYGTGTEKVEEELIKLFPGVRTLRWDYETTRQKGAHDLILSHFSHHQADVLIGTQMLAKGLDFPMVTLVGMILADAGLNLPDYRAGERTFQLLTQVAGRAGRSPLGGKAILQTFQPDHYVIQSAALHDVNGFYHQELEYRRLLKYPPFYRIARIEVRHLDKRKAELAARQLAEQIREWIEQGDHRGTDLTGPVPSFYFRQNRVYRWQMILRGPDPAKVLRGKSLEDFRVEIDPVSLL